MKFDQRTLSRLSYGIAIFLVTFMAIVLLSDIYEYSQLKNNYNPPQHLKQSHVHHENVSISHTLPHRIHTTNIPVPNITISQSRASIIPVQVLHHNDTIHIVTESAIIPKAVTIIKNDTDTKASFIMSSFGPPPSTISTPTIISLPLTPSNNVKQLTHKKELMIEKPSIDDNHHLALVDKVQINDKPADQPQENKQPEHAKPADQEQNHDKPANQEQKHDNDKQAEPDKIAILDSKPMDRPPINVKPDMCMRKYNHREYLPIDSAINIPPALYTFPGSGNTWVRLLIEYATGIYTGSLYNDRLLINTFPGEYTCNNSLSIIKAHTNFINSKTLLHGDFQGEDHKCQGQVKKFDRVIMLVRNPYDSIWSEFQRRMTKSHVNSVLKKDFQANLWDKHVSKLAYLYYDMMDVQYQEIEKSINQTNFVYVKYEDFKNDDMKIQSLDNIVKFLSLPEMIPSSSQNYDKKLSCAFLLANDSHIHRTVDNNDYMKKEDVYNKKLVCSMWKLFGKYSSRFGYQPYGGYACDQMDVPVIPPHNK